MKKYKLINKAMLHRNTTVYRIQALVDFDDVKAGDLGGWIESENNLSHDGNCWVYDDAIVSERATVTGNAKVRDNAMVCDNAAVRTSATIGGNAIIRDNAQIYASAIIIDNAIIRGSAKICDNAKIFGDAVVCDHALVCENALVRGTVTIYGIAVIGKDGRLYRNNDYIYFQNFGSYDRATTLYKTIDGYMIKCGCFASNDIDEFIAQIQLTHKDSAIAEEYLTMAELMKIRIRRWGANKLHYMIRRITNMNLKKMIKSGVKVVETNGGDRWFVLVDRLIGKHGWIALSQLDDDLVVDNNLYHNYTIKKVFNNPIKDIDGYGESWNFGSIADRHLELIWERNAIELTEIEKMLLASLHSDFRYIARDMDGHLAVYKGEPTWNDKTEDWHLYGNNDDICSMSAYSHWFAGIASGEKGKYSIGQLLEHN